MKTWQKWLSGILAILVVVTVAAVLVGCSLGADISTARQQKLATSPHYDDGAFFNVERQAPMAITWEMVREQIFGGQQREPLVPLPVVPLSSAKLEMKPAEDLKAIWLGHASVLIEIAGQRLLTDPVLSERASPFQFIGPKRFHPPPIALEQLSGIDAVIISHNHYDHLDEATIRHLGSQGTRFFVPLGVGAHLEDWGIAVSQIREMDWWQTVKIGRLTITATPNRHYSGRGLFDYKATFWASWSIVGPKSRVFYSGDTGYSELFREIGDRLGPFDLNIIKIGSYGPGASWNDIHMNPEDAVQVHLDIGGKYMLPVHWATFNLAIHDWDEPIRRALKASEQHNVRLLTPKIGEAVSVDRPFVNTHWWEVGN